MHLLMFLTKSACEEDFLDGDKNSPSIQGKDK